MARFKTKLTIIGVLFAASVCMAQSTTNEKHVEVGLRMIGHRVLLNAGDSISLVLPIEKDGNQYTIRFESEFAFNPDSLVSTVNAVLTETRISNGYILEVIHCETERVVYSFEMSNIQEAGIIPCITRSQPKSCYYLVLNLLQEPTAQAVPVNTIQPEEPPNSATNYYIIGGVLSVLALGLSVWRGKSKPGANSQLIKLGKYRFDQRNAELILQEQRTELTGKEADLLLLLYNRVNTTVERDEILNKVWQDEGDYIGRTLDVFISKLRKKLEADPTIKIINVRGVGYKLVLN